MHPFDELKSYVQFGEDDVARLATLWGELEPHIPEIVDKFYAEIMAAPRARAIIKDDAQLERLRQTFYLWAEELLLGPHDAAYFERRQRIGRVHVTVALPSRFMFTAMSVVRRELSARARALGHGERTCDSIEKITSLDLAIMNGTYNEGRERAELTTLQDLIVSHLPVTMLLIDQQGLVAAATRPSARLFAGIEMIGKPYTEALPPALVAEARLEEHLLRALDSGHQVALTRVDVEIDGDPRSFRVTIVPLNHALGAALIHVEELTEAVSTEARLQRAEALAQLGTFSAAVAHELRNPLAGMRGALQVISETLEPGDTRRAIMGKIDHQIVRLNEMITDLLQFARPPDAKVEPVGLGAAARAAVEAVRAEHPDTRFDVDGDGEAIGDETLVHRVLVNLVQNAVQATNGNGRVLVTVRPGKVRVSDDGPGVPVEQRVKVFLPFFTTRSRGTGLGLAICRQAAAAMRGTVSLVEGPLEGASFELELPLPT